MPKTLRHRGPDPEDARAFSPAALPILRLATSDLCWLLERGYALASAADLVANRYKLVTRQRLALSRCACPKADIERRQNREVHARQLRGQDLWIDGFNVVTALESALGGGIILIGGDGCCRDVAGIHRRYHKVVETVPALELAGQFMAAQGIRQAAWWLDSPIENSGRLKTILRDVAAQAGWNWRVELVLNPDQVLSQSDQIVATADRRILDQCRQWFNLARAIIQQDLPHARIIDLSADCKTDAAYSDRGQVVPDDQ